MPSRCPALVRYRIHLTGLYWPQKIATNENSLLYPSLVVGFKVLRCLFLLLGKLKFMRQMVPTWCWKPWFTLLQNPFIWQPPSEYRKCPNQENHQSCGHQSVTVPVLRQPPRALAFLLHLEKPYSQPESTWGSWGALEFHHSQSSPHPTIAATSIQSSYYRSPSLALQTEPRDPLAVNWGTSKFMVMGGLTCVGAVSFLRGHGQGCVHLHMSRGSGTTSSSKPPLFWKMMLCRKTMENQY